MSVRLGTWTKKMFFVAPLCAALLAGNVQAQTAIGDGNFNPDALSDYLAGRFLDPSASANRGLAKDRAVSTEAYAFALTALKPRGPDRDDGINREWIVHRGKTYDGSDSNRVSLR